MIDASMRCSSRPPRPDRTSAGAAPIGVPRAGADGAVAVRDAAPANAHMPAPAAVAATPTAVALVDGQRLRSAGRQSSSCL